MINNIETKKKNNKGITLIALVITIIVMLILVAVTITMAVNGGLFEYASNAGSQTNEAIIAEQQLASGKLKVGELWYNSIDDYIKNIPSSQQDEFTFIIMDSSTSEETEYTAQEGMTWEKWLNSSYNVNKEYKALGNRMVNSDETKNIATDSMSNNIVNMNEVIQKNRTYYLVPFAYSPWG